MEKNYPVSHGHGRAMAQGLNSYLLLFIMLSMFSGSYAQSYTFTPAGAVGATGPTQGMITTAYNGTSLQGSVTIVTQGIQEFVVPSTGMYSIRAVGGQGWGTFGGRGADMYGEFNLTAGQVLRIMVGQAATQPVTGTNQYGGGGGSFVTTSANAPLIVAGGGGGNSAAAFTGTADATTSNNGRAGANSGTNGAGGTNGNGGGQGSTSFGGGGLVGDGTGAQGGKSFINGGVAGTGTGNGGFGGGGGCTGQNNYRMGGGGGYSGGGGAGSTAPGSTPPFPEGGGGGSFNSGANQVNVAGTNLGSGRVIIEHLCSLTIGVIGGYSGNTMCTSNSVTLTTNGISTYSWSNGATTSSIVVSPASNTSYSLTAMSPMNCTASAAVLISVVPSIPNLTVASTANSGGICPGGTVALTATGGPVSSYTWTGGSVPVNNGVSFSPGAGAIYTVESANACGTGSAVTSVSIHPLPTVSGSASQSSLCSGSTLTLTGNGTAVSYTWSGGSSAITDGAGFQPANTATYTVVGSNALGCKAQATIPVTVVATPNQAPVAIPVNICLGGNSTLTATGATSYTWASSTQTVFTQVMNIVPTATGVSTYTVTKSNGICSDVKTISVTTFPLPSIFAMASPVQVCALQPVTLSIGGGSSYTWTAPGTPNFSFTTASQVVYPPSSSVYTAVASDGTCTSMTTVSVTADPNPTINVTATSPTLCNGQAVTISANGATNYTWTTSPATGTFFTASIIDSPTTAISYNVVGENNGCTSTGGQVVIVFNNPVLSITSNKSLVCSAGSAILTASGANTYTWDATTNNLVGSSAPVNPVRASSGLVTYTVTGTDVSTGCSASQTINVSVYVPTLAVNGNTSNCLGGPINLAAAGGNLGSYAWNTGSGAVPGQGLSINIAASGVYTVSAISSSAGISCPASRTVAVDVLPNPNIAATSQRSVVCKFESVELYATGGVLYSWNNFMGGATITVTPPYQTNTYQVTGTDALGCKSTATVVVKMDNCTGIEGAAPLNNLVIYPNPSNGAFTIKADADLRLTLSNELGQVIRQLELNRDNDHKVSVSDLPTGIYFVTGEKVHYKVVITR